ncbi:hypothetical protein J6590_034825 [Homalodisca vitripennis]|nr:hypothetical protein J6590_034825 [Homalodisca vitripennis]
MFLLERLVAMKVFSKTRRLRTQSSAGFIYYDLHHFDYWFLTKPLSIRYVFDKVGRFLIAHRKCYGNTAPRWTLGPAPMSGRCRVANYLRKADSGRDPDGR